MGLPETGKTGQTHHLFHLNLTDAMMDPRPRPSHEIRNAMHGEALTPKSPPRLRCQLIKMQWWRRSANAVCFPCVGSRSKRSKQGSGSSRSKWPRWRINRWVRKVWHNFVIYSRSLKTCFLNPCEVGIRGGYHIYIYIMMKILRLIYRNLNKWARRGLVSQTVSHSERQKC